MLDVHFHFDDIGKIVLSFLHGLRKKKRGLDTPDDYKERFNTLSESNRDIFIMLLLQRNKEICVEPSVPQSWKQGDSLLKVGVVPIDEEVFDVRKEPWPMEPHLPQQWGKINRGMYKWAKRNKKKILSKGKHFL